MVEAMGYSLPSRLDTVARTASFSLVAYAIVQGKSTPAKTVSASATHKTIDEIINVTFFIFFIILYLLPK